MSEFTTILAVVVLAVLAPLLAKRVRIPVVVTEVILGFAVGAAVFLWSRWRGVDLLSFEAGGPFEFLAEIGFIMLLFLIGLEIDFDQMRKQGLGPVLMAVGLYASSFTLAFAFTRWAQLPFIVTLLLSTTAVDVVLPTMRERGLHRSRVGQVSVLSATIADLATVSVLATYLLVLAAGGTSFDVRYLFVPALLLVFWLAYKLGNEIVWQFPRTLSRFFKAEDPTELGVRTSLALMFVFVALSQAFGVEAIFGAFFAGVLISLLFREGALLEAKLFGLGYGFFIPIFFMGVGLQFDFGVFVDLAVLSQFPLLLAAAILVKLVPAVVLLSFQYGFRNALAIGFLLTTRLSFLIVAASVALALGIIDTPLYTAIVAMALVLAILGPTLFRLLAPSTDEGTVGSSTQPEVSAA